MLEAERRQIQKEKLQVQEYHQRKKIEEEKHRHKNMEIERRRIEQMMHKKNYDKDEKFAQEKRDRSRKIYEEEHRRRKRNSIEHKRIAIEEGKLRLEFEKVKNAQKSPSKNEKFESDEYKILLAERKKLNRDKMEMQKEKILLEEAKTKSFERKIIQEKELQLKIENDHLRKLIDTQNYGPPTSNPPNWQGIERERLPTRPTEDYPNIYPDVYVEEDSTNWNTSGGRGSGDLLPSLTQQTKPISNGKKTYGTSRGLEKIS